MKALIFNSGIGKRMGDLTKTAPKCMAEIGCGHTIISWQLFLLEQCGIHEVVITTGPFAERLEQYIDSLHPNLQIKFVKNPLYDTTNYIYSMYCARNFLNDDVIILHGDLVLEPSVLNDLLAAQKSALTVDKSLALPEKDFKAQIQNSKIKAVGIEFFGNDCVACQPAYKLFKKDIDVWLKEVENYCDNGQRGVYAENALNAKSDEMAVYPLELNGRLCNEIDNLEDLKIISARFEKCFDSLGAK